MLLTYIKFFIIITMLSRCMDMFLNQKTIWAEHWVNPGLSCHLWFVIAFTISLPSSDTMWQKGMVNLVTIPSISYFTFEVCVREKKGTSGIFRSNFRKVHNSIKFNQDEMLKNPVWYLSCAASLCYNVYFAKHEIESKFRCSLG